MKLGNFSRRRADGSFSFIILPEKRKRGSDFLVVFSKKWLIEKKNNLRRALKGIEIYYSFVGKIDSPEI